MSNPRPRINKCAVLMTLVTICVNDNSLAEGMKRRKPRNVAFIHVPPGKSGADLKAGV
jgi:hypothetical protein